MDKYANLIYKMLQDEFNISDICKYLRHIDRKLDLRELIKIVNKISTRYFNCNSVNKKSFKHSLIKQSDRITRNEILKYLTTIHKKKSRKVRRHWSLLKKEYPVIKVLEKFYRYFHNCLNETTATQIDKYIDEYKNNNLPLIKQFIKGLSRDLMAIKEGIKTKISSGFVEGGINKIKLIKRLSYGRMKLPRLKQKILTIAKFFNTNTLV